MLDLHAITPLALAHQIPGVFIPFDDKVELMQFTGIKDESGIEIYEGDIARIPSGPLAVCRYEGDSFYLIGIDPKQRGPYAVYFRSYGEKPTVIGNIHENPELLQG